jgi:HEAT repeat protein
LDIPAIVSVFACPGEKAQLALIARLARDQERSLPLLMSLIDAAYPAAIQRWAVEGLGAINDSAVVRPIVAALKSPHMTVRLHAIRAIQRRGERRLARYLRRLMDDDSGGIRMNALQALVALSPRWIAEVLIAAQEDAKYYVRRYAARALNT